MDIQEAKAARSTLAQAIAKLIEDFEWDTGTEVAGITINRGGGRDRTQAVDHWGQGCFAGVIKEKMYDSR